MIDNDTNHYLFHRVDKVNHLPASLQKALENTNPSFVKTHAKDQVQNDKVVLHKTSTTRRVLATVISNAGIFYDTHVNVQCHTSLLYNARSLTVRLLYNTSIHS